jgi:hypothetical protein
VASRSTARRVVREGNPDYEADFCAWAERQAALVRSGRFAELDVENVAEELEAMSRSQKLALRSRLVVLMAHLLKYEFQPLARTGSWRGTIVEQRQQIRDLLEDSPSLLQHLVLAFNDSRRYADAVRLAAAESGLLRSAFPASRPYTFERALDDEFWPGVGPHQAPRSTERKKRS